MRLRPCPMWRDTTVKDEGKPKQRRTERQPTGADVAKWKTMAKNMQDCELQSCILAEMVPSPVFINDIEGRYLYVNKSAAQFLGKESREVEGTCIFDYFPPEITARMIDHIREVYAHKKVVHADYVLTFRGDRHFFTLLLSPLFNQDGEVTSVLEIAHDITELKEANEKLAQSEARVQALLDAAPDSMFLIDPQGKLLAHNKALCKRFQRSPGEDLSGKNILDLVEPELAEMRVAFAVEAMRTGKPVWQRDRRGDLILDNRIQPVMDSNGKVNQLAVFSRDITDMVKAEEILREREKSLEAKTRSLSELNIALKVLLDKRSQDREEVEERIVSSVKHLVEPYLEKLAGTQLDKKQKDYLQILKSNLQDILSPLVKTLSSDHYGLTPKEIQVAMLVMDGKTTKEIAELLHTSVRSIEFHRANLRKKLGLKNKPSNLRSSLISISK